MSGCRAAVCFLIANLCMGCAALREPGEVAWQTMHVVDTLQTLDLARDPRYKEVESAWLIGAKPDDKTVLAWSMGMSLAHAGVTQLLHEHDLPLLSKFWQYMTLSMICNAVGHNAAIGIRIGGANTGPDFRRRDFQLGPTVSNPARRP